MNSELAKQEESQRNGPAPGKLHQIQELLFGEQARQTDQQLSEVRNEASRALADLQVDLVGRIASQAADSDREADEIRSRITGLSESLEAKLSQLQADQAAATKALQESFADELARTRNESEHALAELAERTRASLDDLRSAKVDRSGLSDLFGDLALRLADPLEEGE